MTHITKKLQANHLKVFNAYKFSKGVSDFKEDEILVDYYNFLTGTSAEEEDLDDRFEEAYELFKDNFQKEVIEALLLSDANYEDINTHFGIDTDVLKIYKYLFFETDNFNNHLEKLSYLENYKASDFGKELKVRAVNLGPEFIYFRYANIVPNTKDQRDAVKKMFMASAYRAMEANYTDINSKTSKSALEWGKIMLRAYEAIENLMNEDATDTENILRIVFGEEEEPNSSKAKKSSGDKDSVKLSSDDIV